MRIAFTAIVLAAVVGWAGGGFSGYPAAPAVTGSDLSVNTVTLTTAGADGVTFTGAAGNARLTWGTGQFCKSIAATGHTLCTGGFDGPNISLSAAGSSFLVDSATAPTVTACTSPSITWNTGNALVRFAVGSSCTGIKAATLTFPTAANCWGCSCYDTTTTANDIRQTNCSQTTAVITNFGSTIGTPTDFTAAESIQCMCRGG